MSLATKPTYAVVGDKIVDELNDPAQVWAGKFTAKRVYLAKFTPSELKSLRVVVVPDRTEQGKEVRSGRQRRHTFDIAFRKDIAPDDVAKVDELTAIVEAVADYYGSGGEDVGRRTIAETDCPVVEVEILPLASPEEFEKNGRFYSVVQLTVLQVSFAENETEEPEE